MLTELPESGFNLARVFTTIAAAVPDQEVLVQGERRYTYEALADEVDALARFLAARGLGCTTERSQLGGHESGQDHLALYLYNCPEYLLGMLASFRSRVAPININYRYVAEELAYVLRDSRSKVLVFASSFAAVVAQVRDHLPDLEVLVQVPDGLDGEPPADLLPGAMWYADALAEGRAADIALPEPAGDDLYIVYTGGTTGMPKGVLWRQDDMFVTSMGGTPFGSNEPYTSYDQLVDAAVTAGGGMRLMMALPFMHGAAQWSTFHIMTGGGSIVLAENPRAFDAPAVLATASRERCVSLPVVGDAMVRPIIKALEQGEFDLSGLAAINNGAAPLSAAVRDRLLELLPHIMVMDAAGASETGLQMSSLTMKGMDAEAGTFTPVASTVVVDDTKSRVVAPGGDHGESGSGWLAQRKRAPLGYLGDAVKTAEAFPTIGGERFAVPGDRAEILPDGRIHLLGRESVTINSGGEKIFAEEVEGAVGAHPAVLDVLVVGRPSEKWGAEPVAVVSLDETAGEISDEALLAVASERIARYKLPKAFIRVPHVQRSPSGKADYAWARAQLG
ncbi:acyl-CoA synthetase [Nocardioides acrostichi]|uniref:Acyl-CoA synthetase n=1 Tax=Nocardioides acrostichi TaxID=2784339 RepID=A0A930YBA1_9ACTN|nr:acyl-CoA synthetase [Nocardioides acrostichi]MBF4162248.1 acyl-CoA synthetase [Nocardioides acrostichi]